MKTLISDFLSKNGYIDLKNIDQNLMLHDKYGNSDFLYKGKKYYFKSSSSSGGINFQNKEVFESFISKLIKNYTPTISYFPAILNNDKGVVSLHWDELGENYLTLDRALKIKGCNSTYMDSVCDFEDEYKLSINSIMDKKILNEIRKAPIQLMCGNYDFKTNNIAVTMQPEEKITNFMAFDYGFNLFSIVESYLESYGLDLSTPNVEFVLNKLLNTYFNIMLGFGAKKNLNNYSDFKDFKDDFTNYAKQNKCFRKTITTACTVPSKIVDGFKEMKEYNYTLSKHQKELIKIVTNYMASQYSQMV